MGLTTEFYSSMGLMFSRSKDAQREEMGRANAEGGVTREDRGTRKETGGEERPMVSMRRETLRLWKKKVRVENGGGYRVRSSL